MEGFILSNHKVGMFSLISLRTSSRFTVSSSSLEFLSSPVFLPPTVVFGLVEFSFTICMLLSSGQEGGEEGEATGGASATHGLSVIVVVLDLLFSLVLVLIEILVEVLILALVLDAALVEVGAGGVWIELPGLLLLVEGKGDADWKRSSSELLDKRGGR